MIRANLLSALAFSALATLLVTASGCSICGTCFDYEYAAYGGATPRGDRIHGRVNSLFAPAEAGVYAGGEVMAPADEFAPAVDPMAPEPPMANPFSQPPMGEPMGNPFSEPGFNPEMGTRSNLVPQRAAIAPVPAKPITGGRIATLPNGEKVTLAPGEVLETEMTSQQRSMLVR